MTKHDDREEDQSTTENDGWVIHQGMTMRKKDSLWYQAKRNMGSTQLRQVKSKELSEPKNRLSSAV